MREFQNKIEERKSGDSGFALNKSGKHNRSLSVLQSGARSESNSIESSMIIGNIEKQETNSRLTVNLDEERTFSNASESWHFVENEH